MAAVDQDGTLAYFSNYGPSVPIAAPGVNILSACYLPATRGRTCTSNSTLYSGTSQASEWPARTGWGRGGSRGRWVGGMRASFGAGIERRTR